MNRRNFIGAGSMLALSVFSGPMSSILKGAALASKVIAGSTDFKNRIVMIIKELKFEGSNLVKKIMNKRKYVFDPFTHYPFDGGLKDANTGNQLFFHIHRLNEFGHFHTFATDEEGSLVHLVLISMNKHGEPLGLATVNRWVTGDKYAKADTLKILSKRFFVSPELYVDKRVVEFVNHIFKAFQEEINNLYDERDNWISEYVNKNYSEPFEDRDYEIISYKEINLAGII